MTDKELAQVQKVKTDLLVMITASNMQDLLDRNALRHQNKQKAKRFISDFEGMAVGTLNRLSKKGKELDDIDIYGSFEIAIEDTLTLFAELFIKKDFAQIIQICKVFKGFANKDYSKIDMQKN